jgi:hypothetical protein
MVKGNELQTIWIGWWFSEIHHYVKSIVCGGENPNLSHAMLADATDLSVNLSSSDGAELQCSVRGLPSRPLC